MPINIINKKECCGCGVCSNICPKNCIGIETGKDGFTYPVIDTASCVDCKLCESVCPFMTQPYKSMGIKVYTCHSKDEDIRYNSSSGGIFSELATMVFDENGIVFGAAFDDTMELVPASAENKYELERLKGSKYVQCSTGDIYTRVKAQADTGRKVLFCGTPCQVKGMKGFLKKAYDNVLLVDFVCHGVPSMDTLRKYIAAREKESGKKIVNLSFRDKSISWESSGMRILYEDRTTEFCKKDQDYFLRGFLKNLFLRDSCHNCKVKNLTSGSDLTLGDCWRLVGTSKNDHKGESIVICNSKKGADALKCISERIISAVSDFEIETRYNRSAVHSVGYGRNRQKFFEVCNKLPFDEIIKRYTKDSLIVKAKRIIRKIL